MFNKARLNLTLLDVFLDRHFSECVHVVSAGYAWPQALAALFGAVGTPEFVLKKFRLKRKDYFKQLERSG